VLACVYIFCYPIGRPSMNPLSINPLSINPLFLVRVGLKGKLSSNSICLERLNDHGLEHIGTGWTDRIPGGPLSNLTKPRQGIKNVEGS